MPEHRFQDLLADPPMTTVAPSLSGFAPCPSVVVQNWSAAQQAWVGQLYRIAYERAQAELQSLPRYFRLLTASWN
jgi:hypothetical protein